MIWALRVYHQTYKSPVSKKRSSPVGKTATLIGRPVTGVYNKVMNFRSIDPRDQRARPQRPLRAEKACPAVGLRRSSPQLQRHLRNVGCMGFNISDTTISMPVLVGFRVPIVAGKITFIFFGEKEIARLWYCSSP